MSGKRRKHKEVSETKRGEGWSFRRTLIVVSLVFIILIIYGVWRSMQTPIKPSPSPSPQYEAAPTFTLTDIDGVSFSLEDFRGKVVILDFFYIRCPPCKGEILHLLEVFKKYGSKGLVMISISVDPAYDTVQRLQNFREENGIEWRIARDTAGVSEKYLIRAVPTIVIIDQNGFIRYRHVGLTSASTLMEEVESLLGV